MDLNREKDIQELCNQVLESYPNHDWDNGRISCPFCSNTSYGNEIQDIEHNHNCAYLISKDLSTKRK